MRTVGHYIPFSCKSINGTVTTKSETSWLNKETSIKPTLNLQCQQTKLVKVFQEFTQSLVLNILLEFCTPGYYKPKFLFDLGVILLSGRQYF